MSEPTKRPWRVGPYGGLYPVEGGACIGACRDPKGRYYENCGADEKHIVKCVNSHDALDVVGAAEERVHALEDRVAEFEAEVEHQGNALDMASDSINRIGAERAEMERDRNWQRSRAEKLTKAVEPVLAWLDYDLHCLRTDQGRSVLSQEVIEELKAAMP